MKFKFLVVFAAILMSVVACENKNVSVVDKNIDQSNGTINKTLLSSNIQAAMWHPEGAVVTRVNSHTIAVEAPEEWNYIYRNIEDNGGESSAAMVAGGQVSISCDCTEGSGCEAADIGGTTGCVMSADCKKCNLTSTVGVTLDGVVELIEIERGGFVNPKQGVKFIYEETNLPMFMPEIMEIEELRKELDAFFQGVYGDKEAPKATIEHGIMTAPPGYVFAGINAFGRGASVLVPVDVVNQLQIAANGGTSATRSCSCSEGSCEGVWLGYIYIYIYMCRAFDCTGTCTLSGAVAADHDVVVGYRF